MVKSPAMIINELCAKSGTMPEFTDSRITPVEVNPPVFSCRCKVVISNRTYEDVATGNSKKMAKQNVCENILRDKIRIYDSVNKEALAAVMNPVSNNFAESFDPNMPPVDEASEYAKVGNPIADLKGFCEDFNLAQPDYSDGERVGPSHCPVILVKCTVGPVEVTGAYMQKKMSKRIAAEKMLHELQLRQKEKGNLQDVEVGEAPVETSEEVNQIRRLIDNAHKDPDSLCFRPPLSKAQVLSLPDCQRQHEEYKIICRDLRHKYPGRAFQTLLEKFREFKKIHPLYLKPTFEMTEWLTSLDNGIRGFFDDLKDEMEFVEDWEVFQERNRDDRIAGQEPQVMVTVTIVVPGFPDRYKPTAINYKTTEEDGEEACIVDVINYLGMIGTRD